jgi:two-component system phosphate regulon response regulator PhoB
MPTLGRKTILSIEDDEEFGRLLELMLKQETVKVVRATNGQDGLRLAEELKPDLIVLDLMMPDMHGWEVLERLQSQEDLQHIPVIVVTALSSRTDVAYGREAAGVEAYLVKPLRTAEFRSAVTDVLSGEEN